MNVKYDRLQNEAQFESPHVDTWCCGSLFYAIFNQCLHKVNSRVQKRTSFSFFDKQKLRQIENPMRKHLKFTQRSLFSQCNISSAHKVISQGG